MKFEIESANKVARCQRSEKVTLLCTLRSLVITMPKVKCRLCQSHKILFCPNCGRRFANETRVLQHMNQPSSACGLWMDNISCLHHHTSAASNHANTRLLDWHQPDSHSDMGLEADNAFAQNEFEPNNSDAAHIPFNRDQNHTPVPVVDSHPNIPSVYPGRTTFMDSSSLMNIQGFGRKIYTTLLHQRQTGN